MGSRLRQDAEGRKRKRLGESLWGSPVSGVSMGFPLEQLRQDAEAEAWGGLNPSPLPVTAPFPAWRDILTP